MRKSATRSCAAKHCGAPRSVCQVQATKSQPRRRHVALARGDTVRPSRPARHFHVCPGLWLSDKRESSRNGKTREIIGKSRVFLGFLRGVAEGIRTPDPQSHNLMLYPTELQPPDAYQSASLLSKPIMVNDRSIRFCLPRSWAESIVTESCPVLRGHEWQRMAEPLGRRAATVRPRRLRRQMARPPAAFVRLFTAIRRGVCREA